MINSTYEIKSKTERIQVIKTATQPHHTIGQIFNFLARTIFCQLNTNSTFRNAKNFQYTLTLSKQCKPGSKSNHSVKILALVFYPTGTYSQS